jgi:hypothetical protein
MLTLGALEKMTESVETIPVIPDVALAPLMVRAVFAGSTKTFS